MPPFFRPVLPPVLLPGGAVSLLRRTGGGGGVAAPTSLTATPVSTSQIDLAWTDNATNEDGYKIYRSTNGVDYAEIDDIAADSESYSDTTITAGTTYYYKVAAYSTAGGEAESNVAAANTLTLNLLSVYEFEDSGNLGKDSHSENHLTNNNAVTQVAGAVGDAADFVAASSQSLTRADGGAGDPFRLAGVSWTMAVLVKPDTINTAAALRYLINKWSGGVTGVGYWLAQINATVQIAIQNAAEGAADTATTGGVLSTSSYTLIVAWLDEDVGTLNIQANNGTPVSVSLNRTRANAGTAFAVGRRSDQLLSFYDGELDQIFIWKGRILTAAERTSLYNGGNFRSYAYVNPT